VRGLELSTATGPRLPLLIYLSDRRLQAVPLGGGTFSLRFEDLSGRVNVNRADPDLLVNLIQLAGLDRSRAEEIADGILDWIDADDLHRGRGAEADYYARRGLAAPRNAPVLRLDELLRVKGMTRDVLYGGGRLAGLTPFLTTEGSGKINVNTAPREVLLAIPGMDAFTVTRILADRERRHLRTLEDVLGREAAARLAANPLLGILSFDATEMRIEAVGELPGSNTRSRVAATVGILPAGVVVRSWQDDVQASAPLAPAAEILLPESS